MQLAEGTVVAGRFRLVRELGHGGMGSVWQAHHTGLDIPCAVKFIHAGVASLPEIRRRFEREAKAAAQLRSPNVVQILDYGVSENVPYIAMEFLEGEDLAARLKRCGRLPSHETASIVSQVARALVKAHAAGLVHRDLKPENVYLIRDDDREIAKVLDFGIAKSNTTLLGDHSTKTGSLLGTPHYMSPEQAQGTKSIDFRSDLWSLAVLAYRCVTGRLPFDSEALGDLLIQIIINPIPVPSQVAPSVPKTFDAWWACASARDPAQRFQSAKELGDALAVALGISQSMGMAAPYAYPNVPPTPATVINPPSLGASPQQGAAAFTPAPAASGQAPSPPQAAYRAGSPSSPTVGLYAPPGPTAVSSGHTTMGTPALHFGSDRSVGSYSGVGQVPATTSPAVSHTMSREAAGASGARNKILAAIVAGVLLGGIGMVLVVRNRGANANRSQAISAGPAAPLPPSQAPSAGPPEAPTPLVPDPAVAVAETATPAPPSNPPTPSAAPTPSRASVVIPPSPPPIREKVKIPPPPPTGKDFGF